MSKPLLSDQILAYLSYHPSSGTSEIAGVLLVSESYINRELLHLLGGKKVVRSKRRGERFYRYTLPTVSIPVTRVIMMDDLPHRTARDHCGSTEVRIYQRSAVC